ncbi:MAG: toll/interleukin-1 receptor domain-containing protein [Burkholderiales bacterium]
MADIFISYRRADSGGYAKAIFDRLRREFGDDAVFRDVDDIDGGTRFPDAIQKQLEGCKVFVVIIGPGWINAPDVNGKRRLDDPNDWVRVELATALKRNLCVIPATVAGAALPAAADLPGDLKPLAEWQRRDLRDGDTWEGDLDLLVRRIAKAIGGGSVFRRRALIAAAVVLVAGAVTYLVAPRITNFGEPQITVQLWDVAQDRQGAVFASRQFAGAPRGKLEEIAEWVSKEIGRRHELGLPNVKGRVHVPKDLSRDHVQIEMTPPGSFNAYISAVQGGQKSRIPLDSAFLAEWSKNFHLEIERPGYQAKVVRVTWGEEINDNFVLEPKAVAIGIREFQGVANAIATSLSNRLAANRRFLIKDPEALQALQDELKKEREFIAANPAAQRAIRTSLGLDVIVTGRYEK